MDKTETLHYLNQLGIAYELVEHPAVFNMAELAQISLTPSGSGC